MPFIREKHYDNAIQKIRINLGKELGLDKEDEAHVLFREPTEKEVLKIRVAKDDLERVDAFKEIFEAGIIDHDFYEKENVRMEDKAVIALLFEKMDTTDKLITEYSNAVFRSRMSEAEGK